LTVHHQATLPDLLDAAAADAPERVAIRFEGRTLTYTDFDVESRHAAEEFGTHGGPILLSQCNAPELAARLFGAYRTGRPVCAIDPDLPSDARREIEIDLGDSAADAAPPTPDGVAVLQYTSGTTGGRKAAMMTHRNLVANARQNNAWFGWTHEDVILGALPLFHTWGLGCVLHAAVAARASIALLRRADMAEIVDVLKSERVTVAYGSATLFHRLLDALGDDAARACRGLRYVKAGAMLVGGTLPERWRAAVPDVPMVLGYGLTEAAPEVCNNPLDAPRAGTVGLPLHGTALRVCAVDRPEQPLPTGEPGEIQVQGPQVMAGYWRRDDETRAALLDGGWLRTGDLGRLDADGYLTVLDRLKDLIKFRGWSVVPATVERALQTFPGVAEVVVVGVAHDVDGEIPVACVVAAAGALDRAALRAHCAARLMPYEVPRRFVFVDAIEKNAVGKPLRRLLRDALRVN
jgi:long-chain acyl-CoA synthetase